MLTQIADGVLVQVSDFMQSNAVVVEGDHGVLLIDAGIRADELAGLAADLRERNRAVVAGFSTHPHWDHLLWHADLGAPPRFGTARCAAAIGARLASDGWRDMVAGMIPADIVAQVPLDGTFGQIVGLEPGAVRVPWRGPEVRIIEHQAHAPGHAALVIAEHGVLVAGDMLSDVLVPILNQMSPDPIGDYLAALDLLAGAVGGLGVVVPGHGSVGADLAARIDLDRAYVETLRDGGAPDDPRLVAPKPGWEWVSGLHERQARQLGEK